jgi:hypothetical protein
MTKTRATAARQIARLERAAVIGERFHHELLALPDSARRSRLLRANRTAMTGIQQQTAKVLIQLQAVAPTNVG